MRLIKIKAGCPRVFYTIIEGSREQCWIDVMTKPIPDKAEVAVEYPDKLYIGTFEQSAFDAHLDETGISLSLHRTGADDVRKSVRMHFHYGLFADILRDLAKTVSSLPASDLAHRAVLRDAAQAFHSALQAADQGAGDETSGLTAKEEVQLLHIME